MDRSHALHQANQTFRRPHNDNESFGVRLQNQLLTPPLFTTFPASHAPVASRPLDIVADGPSTMNWAFPSPPCISLASPSVGIVDFMLPPQANVEMAAGRYPPSPAAPSATVSNLQHRPHVTLPIQMSPVCQSKPPPGSNFAAAAAIQTAASPPHFHQHHSGTPHSHAVFLPAMRI